MSDGGTGEKTEEPTPQKLRQAREKGQVSKSTDIIQASAFVGVFSVLALTFGSMGESMMDFFTSSFDAALRKGDPSTAVSVSEDAIWFIIETCLPMLAAAFVLAAAGNYAQIGFLFTTEPLKPDVKKLNPVTGAKNMVNKKKLVELLKQMTKFGLVTYVTFTTVEESIKDVVLSARLELLTAVNVAGSILYNISVKVAFLFFVIGLVDYFWQKHTFKKDNMMSKYDIKQEYKQSEGDPQQKADRKAMAEELIMHGSQQNVANSDAVITNPVHIAVAIKYDEKNGGAPKVVAKGLRKNAEKIKEIAKESNVPILRNVPLAQALNKLDIDEEIPEELYEAVAEVLNFIAELKDKA